MNRGVLMLALLPTLALGGAPALPAVVAVRVGETEIATGTVLSDGRVLTVEHVLAPGARIEVLGEEASVVRRDADLDLAVLAAPDAGGPGPRIASAGSGDLRVLLRRRGAVEARPATLRRRIRAHLDGRMRPSLDLAVTVAPGDSGAPVVDATGALVAVVFARSTRRDRTAYAVLAD